MLFFQDESVDLDEAYLTHCPSFSSWFFAISITYNFFLVILPKFGYQLKQKKHTMPDYRSLPFPDILNSLEKKLSAAKPGLQAQLTMSIYSAQQLLHLSRCGYG
jgi:hypothetical protein